MINLLMQLKSLFLKLKSKKQKPQIVSQSIEATKKNTIDIPISLKDNIYKIEIKEDISLRDFVDKINSNEEYKVLDLIPNAVLLSLNKINQGTYYVVTIDNRLYSILVNDKKIIIYERIKKELDENEKSSMIGAGIEAFGEHILQDRKIEIQLDDHNYSYSSLKHRMDKDTYYIRSYGKVKNNIIRELTNKDAYNEINSVLCNLETIPGMETILNIGSLRILILDDIKEKMNEKVLEKN